MAKLYEDINMIIGYYPGCALTKGSSSAEYGISIKEILNILGVELREIDDWNCCGASAAHQTNHLLAISLSARNITLATNGGFTEILVPCPACSLRFITAQKEIRANPDLRKKIEDNIAMSYNDKINVLNLPEFIKKYCLERIIEKVKKRPNSLKVVCYYGCLLVRPPKVVEFDDPDDPTTMDEIVKTIGAEPLDWEFKTECCGGGFSISRPDVVTRLVNDIMKNASEVGANAIIVSCPLCHVNLDMRQHNANQVYKSRYNLPVIYLSELIGLALGIEERRLGIDKHFVDTSPLIIKTFRDNIVK